MKQTDFRQLAQEFLQNETQFRLGFLPSEDANPLTMHLDEDFAQSPAHGADVLLSCDSALIPLVRSTLSGNAFLAMESAMRQALEGGRRIVFSSCGAPGRMAVILEASWREAHPDNEQILSIMTGGDYALVRSVENFEDHAETGRQQVDEMSLGQGDVLVGMTATGETTAVLGTAQEAAERGATVFLLICVPQEIPPQRLERCRRLYAHPNVTILSMPCGGMALTGSTRMQSSTLEYLMAATALEMASAKPGAISSLTAADAFESMLNDLRSPQALDAIGKAIAFEAQTYSSHGIIDYLAEDYLLDILSDTTERSPTFMVPPYHALNDQLSPEPWALARNPAIPAKEAWCQALHRQPRCIEWSDATYRAIGAQELLKNGLPPITANNIFQIPVGNEVNKARKTAFQVEIRNDDEGIHYDCMDKGPLKIVCKEYNNGILKTFRHLRLKLFLNTLSTGTMVLLGRVQGNWMTDLNISNKKLVDRACRIISALCGVAYETACEELFRTTTLESAADQSPVRQTIERLGRKSAPGHCTPTARPMNRTTSRT